MSMLDKENALRILKGQDKIQRLRCRLGWHRWTTWSFYDMDPSTFRGGYAACHCADCGMPRMEEPYSKSRSKK